VLALWSGLLRVVGEEGFDLGEHGAIALAGTLDERVAFSARQGRGPEEQVPHTLAALSAYVSAPSASSRRSHALAIVPSPSMVRLDTSSASATSSTLSPPKNRSSMTFA
jgi:hypothetical protein